MGRNTIKPVSILLLILAVCWAPIWVLSRLLSGDWLPGLLWLTPVGLIAALVGAALLIPNSLAAIVALFRVMFKKQLDVVAFLPLVILIAAYLLGGAIPSRPATIFHRHRSEFVALVGSSTSDFQRGDERELRLPESRLYEWASMYEGYSSAVVAEFIVGDFYLPLVYISTDNPDDVRDTCSQGGVPIERLEPGWYVCRRDWN